MSRKKTHFVSDLHMFARRSSASAMQRSMESAVRGSHTFVLGGDIFDFRWSQWANHDQTVEHGLRWLQGLAAVNPECQIHYLLGNHDAHPVFTGELTRLAERIPNLVVHPHLLRLEDCVFLHGDIIDANIPFEGDFHELLNAKRLQEERRARPPKIQHTLYDAAVKARLHRLVSTVVNGNQKVLDRVTRYLEWAGHGPSSGVRKVYFGHTHRPLDEVPYAGMRFFNPGATIKGLDFRIVPVDLDSTVANTPLKDTSA
jgi:UDP-2,3-diacylglucosamine pyrophosphatase LpxH